MEQLVTDELWAHFSPLIPTHAKSPKGGRPRKDDRACLEGIVYILQSGAPWRLFPDKQFGVSKSVCHARFSEWSEAGVFADTHLSVLNKLGLDEKIDQSTAVVDSASVRAVFGGRTPDQVRSIAAKTAVNGT